MTEHVFIDIAPVPKPRMTQRDKWAKRPCVVKYRDYKDSIKDAVIEKKINPDDYGCLDMVFCVPMPKSWSKKKKQEYYMKPHQQRPDVDNLAKSVMDSLYEDDSAVHAITAYKIWSFLPRVQIGFRNHTKENYD